MQTSDSPLLGVLTREGVLINVSVRFWRGCKKLKAEDICVDPTRVSDRLISLGHKRLLPRETLSALSLVESRAHALIDSSTFPFLGGLSHFLPNRKLAEVTSRLNELETEFWQARDEFLRSYAAHREDAVKQWKLMARGLVEDPERLVATIEGAFPAPSAMGRHFGFEVQLFQLAIPECLEAQLITLADQQEIVRSRQAAAQQATQKIRQDTEAFVADCVASLREQTATLCQEMLASIGSGKTEGVHQKTLNRLINFIAEFKQLNFANDAEMEEQLERVRRELLSRTAEEYRDSSHAQRKLVEGLNALASKARELAQADASEIVERFGQLGRRRIHLAA